MPRFVFQNPDSATGICPDPNGKMLPRNLGPWHQVPLRQAVFKNHRTTIRNPGLQDDQLVDEILAAIDNDLFFDLLGEIRESGYTVKDIGD